MNSQFSDIRKEYKKGKLTRNTISENPFEQFARWLNDALHCGENEPTAMIVATVSPDGRPSTRTVLLKGVENGKLIFFTNYESRKGRQLTANPYISLSFVWHKLERQVHIEGKAEKCTPQESDAYFSTRPYKSRIGARISPQSHVISSRMEIIRAFVKEAARLTPDRPYHVPTTGAVLPSPPPASNSGRDGKAGCTTVSNILSTKKSPLPAYRVQTPKNGR